MGAHRAWSAKSCIPFLLLKLPGWTSMAEDVPRTRYPRVEWYPRWGSPEGMSCKGGTEKGGEKRAVIKV